MLGAPGKQSTNGNGRRRCKKSGNEHLCSNPYSIAICQANLKNKHLETSFSGYRILVMNSRGRGVQST